MLRLGVLVSGSGTNLQAILDAIAAGKLDAEVRLVISNKPGVQALERAQAAGVETLVISHRDYEGREAFDAALVKALQQAGVDWVVLAGFMRLLTKTLLEAFPWRVINIHPALLPAFPGVNAQKQAIDYGVKITGATVHLVDEGTDTGPIVGQQAVPVLEDDDVDSLQQRLLKVEHALLVECLTEIERGRVEVIEGDSTRRPRVVVRP